MRQVLVRGLSVWNNSVHDRRRKNSRFARRKAAKAGRTAGTYRPAAYLYLARGEWVYRSGDRDTGEIRARPGSSHLPILLRRQRAAAARSRNRKRRTLGRAGRRKEDAEEVPAFIGANGRIRTLSFAVYRRRNGAPRRPNQEKISRRANDSHRRNC